MSTPLSAIWTILVWWRTRVCNRAYWLVKIIVLQIPLIIRLQSLTLNLNKFQIMIIWLAIIHNRIKYLLRFLYSLAQRKLVSYRLVAYQLVLGVYTLLLLREINYFLKLGMWIVTASTLFNLRVFYFELVNHSLCFLLRKIQRSSFV